MSAEHTPYSWDDEDVCFMDEDAEDTGSGVVACRFCSCLIGDEVGYGDDWGEGPICENCIKPWPEGRR